MGNFFVLGSFILVKTLDVLSTRPVPVLRISSRGPGRSEGLVEAHVPRRVHSRVICEMMTVNFLSLLKQVNE